jgi:hypothetical protein
MKKLFLSIISLFSLVAFAQNDKVIADANAVVRTLNGSFNSISVSSGIDLYLTQGNEESAAVSAADAKQIDMIKTEIVNGTLKIYFDNKGVTWKSDHKRLKAYVSFKALEKLDVSSGSDVKVTGAINSDKLKLDVSSGSEFNGTINAKELMADVSSGATIKISGMADKLTIQASSGSDFKGYDFVTDYCMAKASSGSGIHVTINKELSAKASSGGDIVYKGTALIRDIKTSSGGAVKKA